MPDFKRVSPFTLSRRDDGRYEVVWYVKPPGANQRRRQRMVRCADPTDLHQAEEWLRTWPGPDPDHDTSPMCVLDAVARYLEEHAKPRGQERSLHNTMAHIVGVLGSYALDALEPDDIEAYIKRRSNDVKASTIARELTALQAALNWTQKVVLRSDRRYAFRKPAGGSVRDRWITEAQERDIYAALPSAPLDVQIFVRLGLTYGVRRGAMLELRYGDQIDWRSETIDFNKPGAALSRKRRPMVPMTPEVRDLLARRMSEIGGGRVLERGATLRRYADFMASIGLEWVTPHVLKHSAITLMIRGGAQIEDVAKLTNTSPITLHKNYRHHSRDELLAVATARRR